MFGIVAPLIASFLAGASPIAIAATQIAVGVGISMLSRAVFGQAQGRALQNRAGEVLTEGDKTPQVIQLGRFYTAGHVVGPFYSLDKKSQGIPNDTGLQIKSIADYPITGLDRVWIDGTVLDIADFGGSTAIGSGGATAPASSDYNGHLWLSFATGTQVVADSHLVTKFSAHAERPWTSNHIGTGVAYYWTMATLKTDVVSGHIASEVEGRGAKLYDRRLDSTAGGTGSHRLATPSTWAFSENPIVQVAQILHGIPLADGTVYGYGEDEDALPYAEWATAADACDALVSGEPAYRAGLTIPMGTSDRGGMVPAQAIEEILIAGNAQVANVAGQWRVRVGGPELPLVTITDADICVSEPQQLGPFRSRTERFNGCRVLHPDPDQQWAQVEAPVRINADAVARDGETIIASLVANACPYPDQAQLLAQSLIDDHQRKRRHVIVLPPEYAILTPLRSLAWTSVWNIYTAKVFEVEEMAVDPVSLFVTLSIRERDPDDYDPNITITPPNGPSDAIVVQAAFTLPGLAVAPATVTNATATSSAPAIAISWTPGLASIEEVQWEVRRDGTTTPVAPGSIAAAGGAVLVMDGILASTAYEVRARGVRQDTAWSAWISVTTDPARLGAADIDVDAILADLEAEVAAAQAYAEAARDELLAIIGDGASALGPVMGQIDSIVQDLELKASAIETDEQLVAVMSALTDLQVAFEALGGKLADAGLAIDPETGKAVLYGTVALAEQVTDVRLALDAALGTIGLYATTLYVDQAVSDALLDPSQIPVIAGIETTLAQVGVEIDALAASLSAYATVAVVDGIAAEVTTAQLAIDALEASIALKVDQTEFDGLDVRVTTAETTLSALDGAQITTLVQDVIGVSESTDALEAVTLDALLLAYEAQQYAATAVAYARQDFFAKVVEGESATASLRTELGAQIANTVALIETEQLVRSEENAALASITEALDVRLSDAESDQEAQAQAATLLESRVSEVEGVTEAQSTSITELNSEIDDIDTTITGIESVNATQATAISGLQTTTTTQAGQITSLSTAQTTLDARVTDAEGDIIAGATATEVLETRVDVTETSIESQSTQITTLQSDLNLAELDISGIESVNAAQATALTGLQTTTTTQAGQITSLSTAQTTLNARVDDAEGDILAQATATDALETRVDVTEDSIVSQSLQITTLGSEIAAVDGSKADATVVDGLATSVSEIDGELTAVSGRVFEIEARVRTGFSRSFDFSGDTLDGLVLSGTGATVSYGTTTDPSPMQKRYARLTFGSEERARLAWIEDLPELRGRTVRAEARFAPRDTVAAGGGIISGLQAQLQVRRETSVSDPTPLTDLVGPWVDIPAFVFSDAPVVFSVDVPDDQGLVFNVRLTVKGLSGQRCDVLDLIYYDATTVDALASITSTQVAQATEIDAIADDYTLLTAQVGDIEADVLTQNTALATLSSSTATSLTAVNARVDDAEAEAAIQASSIADLEGNAAAALVFRVATPGAVATIEAVAADDVVGGSASAIRFKADTVEIHGDVVVNGAVSVRKLVPKVSGVSPVTQAAGNVVVLAATAITIAADDDGTNPVSLTLFGKSILVAGESARLDVLIQAKISGSWLTVYVFEHTVPPYSSGSTAQHFTYVGVVSATVLSAATEVRGLADVSSSDDWYFTELGLFVQQVNK